MLTQDCLQKIKDVPVVDVVKHYLTDLKPKGPSYQACCPFHGEKTPSFTVSPVRNSYKCFGCGVSGDSINFVMSHKNLTFTEACEAIAKIANISIEYAQESSEQKARREKQLSEKQAEEKVVAMAVAFYQQALHALPETHPAKQFLAEREITEEDITQWRIGWCHEGWQVLTPKIIDAGLYHAGIQTGIIRESSKTKKAYDAYRSRLIFPIKNLQGATVGIAGRYIDLEAPAENEEAAKAKKDIAKWTNPNDSVLYSKSKILFGIHANHKLLAKQGAVLVEGYTDVIASQKNKYPTALGTCGTALTDEQIKLLKHLQCTTVTLALDNDDAGVTAYNKSLPKLLSHGFFVNKLEFTGKDLDEHFRSTSKPPTQHDALVWQTEQLLEAAKTLPEKVAATTAVLTLLADIPNEMLRIQYYEDFARKYKWKADVKRKLEALAVTTAAAAEEVLDDGPIKFPAWVTPEQQEHFFDNGFAEIERTEKGKKIRGYFTFGAGGKTEITNFTVNPIFHIYAGGNSRYMLEIDNGRRRALLDMPAKTIPSKDQFQALSVCEGNYLIFGSTPQWLRIANAILPKFPRCEEVDTLGWHPSGFWCFVNAIYIPETNTTHMLNQWGVYHHKQGDDERSFLIPASCEAYKQLSGSGADPYEQLRCFSYGQTNISFAAWATLMQTVYGTKGLVAVAYTLLTIYRDLVFRVDNNCPHLYGYGEPSSGKSKWAESIMAVFYRNRKAFNVNSGTDAAFFAYVGMVRNAVNQLNEVDYETMKPEWFQALKGMFDGEGRQRYKMGGVKGSVEIQQVEGTVILTGQKLVTQDDNSLVTRSIIESFDAGVDYTAEQRAAYDQLKDIEKNHLSGLVIEALRHRPEIQKHYKDGLDVILNLWRTTKPKVKETNTRILQNYAHLATCYSLLHPVLNLPGDVNDFIEYCFTQALTWSRFIRSSDTLSEFWKTLEVLADAGDILENWDYRIEQVLEATVTVKGERKTIKFTEPTKVINIHMNKCHKEFQKAIRSRTGKEAMSQENLVSYLSTRKYYLGRKDSYRFFKYDYNTTETNTGISSTRARMERNTSCYSFLYADLDVTLERTVSEPAETKPFSAPINFNS